MKKRFLSVPAVFLIIAIPFLATSSSTAERPGIRVGIVSDGPWERDVSSVFRKEITDLLQREFDVRFPDEKRIVADWTVQGVKAAVDRLIADPEVDLLLTLGVLASNDVGHRTELPRPVIAPFVIDAQLQGLPFKKGVSGVKNLSYVTFPPNLARDFKIFREIFPFSKLHFLASRAIHEAVPELRKNVFNAAKEVGVEVEMILVGMSAEEALAALPPDAQAVYLVPMVGLPQAEFKRLVTGFRERRLPSFSWWGRSEVEQGLLVGLGTFSLPGRGEVQRGVTVPGAPKSDIRRLARRVALNMQRILLGEDAGTLPVLFHRSERLTINMETARAIGVYPSWRILTEAELLKEERKPARRLNLGNAVREAIAANRDLAAVDRFVAAGTQNVRQARSRLFPQLEVSSLGTFIDKDRAEASFGAQAQRSFSGSTRVTQLIYSEPALADVQVQRNLQTTREEEREQLRLDIVLDASTAYLNVLRAKTFERIQKENLALTRSNLELARVRRAVGFSGPAEVFRWESQIAGNRRDVIDANAQRNQAEIALNRLLHRPLEERFTTEESSLLDPELVTSDERFQQYIDNPWNFRVFRSFMVQEGLLASPELRRLEAAIAAQERASVSARRAFWAPTVALAGGVTGILAKGGAGADSSLGSLLPLPGSLPTLGNVDWSVGIEVSLPLFTGGARRSELTRSQEELSRLQLEREARAERVEQRIRSALHVTGASYAGIRLSRDAAEAARKNLNLVGDSYSRGVASILDLLDAQNAALVADLSAANAVYDFLIDLMNVQRAIGKFDFFLGPGERDAWFNRLKAFFAARPPR